MDGGLWLICANGTWPAREVWIRLKNQADYIIACDGAYDQCLREGILPDAVIGDMDSVEKPYSNEEVEWIEIQDQHRNDLSKALSYAGEHNAESIEVIGVTGGGIGHQLAPYFALYQAPAQTTIQVQEGRVVCVKESMTRTFSIEIGTLVSLFTLGRAEGVTLTGCEWPLSNATLEPSTRGLNNKVTAETVELTVDKGAVLLCIERDQAGPLGK
jgi:thiamine pyrophosphokinase